ncbi:myosin heavy chain, muscle-like isoform X2 [Homarus americanus]|nr:myosin heavy chain, muscle-like isoform X2 [Homarus americanus]
MQFCHDAFDILGFSKEEVEQVYKITASVMHFGEVKFKQRGREEQAEPDGTEVGETVAKLLGVDGADLYKCITKPKIKVGAEFVAKGMNVNQCSYSVGALAKGLFDRVFKFLVQKCNVTLETGLKRASFIGVLDIAGFEIFDFNGFEQICINFCNEKLQQFFNHHMFVLEQEEYKKEGINWQFVDFGMDLQACIELFEKKMGILSILEEESMFPKATDKSFQEKLNANHLGKSPVFIKPKPPKAGQPDSHFAIVHYAGTVSYNLSGWLEKNKDPLNDTVVDLLKKSSDSLVVLLFADHPGQSGPADTKGGRGAKSGSFKTVSSSYRDQLNNLMKTLNATHPHFIRCIVPNETKSPGVVDAGLIMHQLTCNGVLEGIRICRKGFPNRMVYPDFKHRYKILASKEMSEIKDDKKAAKACFDKAGLDEESYRLGNTKVFFRAGVLGNLEEIRDDRLGKMFSWLQAWIRGFIGRREYKRLQEQRVALIVVQRNLRNFLKMRTWAWFNLWQKVKPLLNVTRIEDEMKALEEKAAKIQADYENEVKRRQEAESTIAILQEEKNNLLLALDSSKGNMSEHLEKQAKLQKQKAELETQIDDIAERLQQEENARKKVGEGKREIEQEVRDLKKTLGNLESSNIQLEEDKAARDHQIKTLTDEVAHQEELINLVKKEKKHLQECNQKTAEDIQCVEDKCTHLNNVKTKLEQTLDELEESLDREKTNRAEGDKQRRKIDSDLRLTQETVRDLERSRKDLESTIERKDKEIFDLTSKVEEEQGIISKFNRQNKELQTRLDNLEQEYQQERQARIRAEQAKTRLTRELTETGDRLEEAGGATAAQIELNKKREAELAKLRREIEENNMKTESALSILRKKHSDGVSELTEQIAHVNKLKARAEKDKESLKAASEESKAVIDRLAHEKADVEKINKQLSHQNNEINFKLQEALRTISDYDLSKKKFADENSDLIRQLDESERKVGELSTIKLSLTNQLSDARKLADAEIKNRANLLGKYRNLEFDIEGLREQLDEENDLKSDLLRQLSKATAGAQMWRAKYESEGVAKTEELEATRLKLIARLDEAEAQIEELNVRNMNLEKNKHHITSEFEQVQVEVDRAQSMAIASEKRQKNFDRIIGEWKLKVDDLAAELDASQKECRSCTSELFHFKTVYEENLENLDSLRRENINLADEIKSLVDQLNNGSKSLDEFQKTAKRLELEKEELQAALEEAESALEQEENKVLRGQVELNQVRQEIERRIQEKEEEFDSTRKCHQRAIETLQSSLEAEAKTKAEALHNKKKLESDINELQAALDHSNKANTEMQRQCKKYQNDLSDLQHRFENEQRTSTEYREQYNIAERKINSLSGDLEESRTLLEQSDRGRRQAETELSDIQQRFTRLTTDHVALTTIRRKLDSEVTTLQADLDELVTEARNSEDKAKKAMLDASHLADELRVEQEHSQTQEKTRKGLEVAVRELQVRLQESELIIEQTGKTTVNRLEGRIRELEGHLDEERRLHAEDQSNLRKCEKRITEITFQSDEERRNHEKMQNFVDKMQQKTSSYRRQVEEAEEIAALNLAKFRKAQQELEDFEERSRVTNRFTVVHSAV